VLRIKADIDMIVLENIELIEIQSDIPVIQEVPGQVPPKNIIEFFKMALPSFKKPELQEVTNPETEEKKVIEEATEKIDFEKTMEVHSKPQISLTQDQYTRKESLSEIIPDAKVDKEETLLDMLAPQEPGIEIEEVGRVAVPKAAYSQPIDLEKKTAYSPMKDIKEVKVDKKQKAYKLSTFKEAKVSIKKGKSTGAKPKIGYGKGTSVGYDKRVLISKRRKETLEELKTVVKPVEQKIKKTEVNLVKKEKPRKKSVEISGPVVGRKIVASYLPAYPDWARAQHIEADVVIRFYVSPQGNVREKLYLERTSGYSKLDQLAMEAIKKWIFEPLETTGGDQWGIITFRYLLK